MIKLLFLSISFSEKILYTTGIVAFLVPKSSKVSFKDFETSSEGLNYKKKEIRLNPVTHLLCFD